MIKRKFHDFPMKMKNDEIFTSCVSEDDFEIKNT